MKLILVALAVCGVALADDSIVLEAKKQFKIAFGAEWVDEAGVEATFALPNRQEFDAWMNKYEKVYTGAEKEARFRNFQMNGWIAQAGQSTELGTAEYGLTQFADLTPAEFKKLYRTVPTTPMQPKKAEAKIPDIQAPDSFDWRKRGAVTPVKNQGGCGSCWSFATTGNIEGQWFLKKGDLVSLSEQQLVDCDKTNLGCMGGWPNRAYDYLAGFGGSDKEMDYPYKGRDGTCRDATLKTSSFINTSVAISQNEKEMATWLAANGPIAILLNAGAMQFYNKGIQHPKDCSGETLDHAVLIVGYGTENNVPFWIVKNSWGTGWGEQGYWRAARGFAVCGLNNAATSSVIGATKDAVRFCENSVEQCPTGRTCCPMQDPRGGSSFFACCPFENAVCCSDKTHCCPNGYKCNQNQGTCEK